MAGWAPFNKRRGNDVNPNSVRPFNMLDDFFDETFSGFPSLNQNPPHDSFKLDVSETEHEYIVEAELPDIKKEEITLELYESTLSISVERIEEKEPVDSEKFYLHKERHLSSMRRSVYLEHADSDSTGLHARLEDGMLKVTIPKLKQGTEKSRKIDIEG